MIYPMMDSQSMPRFVDFTTNVAWNRNVIDVICFNVSYDTGSFSFLATHIAYSCSFTFVVDSIITEGHHGSHLCVKFIKISTT